MKVHQLMFMSFALVACPKETAAPAPEKPTGPAVVELTEEGVKNAQVQVARASPDAFAPKLTVAARLQADPNHLARVGARVTGRVANISVRVGEKVTKGQPLVEIEAVEIHKVAAEYLTALARASEANDALERQRQLANERVTAMQDLRRAEADAAANNAILRESEEHLQFLGLTKASIGSLRTGKLTAAERSIVRAPIDGRIASMAATLGQVLNGTEDLLTIVDSDDIWASLSIYERDLAGVAAGREVTLTVPAYPGRTFKGTLQVVGEVVDTRTHTVDALAKMEGEGALKPGMMGTARVALANDGSTLWLPAEAVQTHSGDRIVFVRTGERRFEVRTVSAGLERAGFVPVSSGIDDGTDVVTRGAFALRGELARAEDEE